MHALQHGIQNKRHIVNTKGTISPLLLIYTVLHHCCSAVVAVHLRGNAHSGGARNRARWDCNPRRDDTVLFLTLKTAQTSLGNGNLWDQGLFPNQLLVAYQSPSFYVCFKITKMQYFSLFDMIMKLEFLKSGSITKHWTGQLLQINVTGFGGQGEPTGAAHHSLA